MPELGLCAKVVASVNDRLLALLRSLVSQGKDFDLPEGLYVRFLGKIKVGRRYNGKLGKVLSNTTEGNPPPFPTNLSKPKGPCPIMKAMP